MTQFPDCKFPQDESSGVSSQTDRDELLAEIEKGEEAIGEGRVLSHEEAKERMSRWLAGPEKRSFSARRSDRLVEHFRSATGRRY